jgi:hypothetical protein
MPGREVLEALVTLQAKGYLEPGGTRYQVSGEGHRMVQHLWQTLHSVEQELFGELSADELEIFKRGLRLLLAEH